MKSDTLRELSIWRRKTAPLGLLLLMLMGCGSGTPDGEPPAIRLQDEFVNASVAGGVTADTVTPTVLTFDGAMPFVYRAAAGVDGLRIEQGRLAGTAAADFPIVQITRTEGLDNPDTLHAIEITARVSGGANISVQFDSALETNIPGVLGQGRMIPWSMSSPLIPGDAVQTYSIPVGTALNANFSASELDGNGTRQILLRPTDEPGASFEIESVRLVFRREYLATVPSGISWQGFRHRSKETLVTRAPERVSYELTLPSRPWLDVSIGTAERLPVTFRVTAEQGGRVVLDQSKTLTTAGRWEPMPVELGDLAGEAVTLTLAVESDAAGAIGYWGAPVVRNRGAMPAAAEGAPQGVILFVADTLRRDHLSAYGYDRMTSPNLDRLAAEGAIVLDNQSQATWTKVSVPAMLSGLYPRTNGVQQMLDRLPAGATTLAEAYREAGYATLGLSGNWFVGSATNLHQGFEDFEESAALDAETADTPSKTARAQVDRLLPWLETHSDVPFFVNIHVTDPHSPFVPQRPYDTYWGDAATRSRYDDAYEKFLIQMPGFQGVGAPAGGQPTLDGLAAAGVAPNDLLQQEIDWYDGSIRGMDAELGRIVETLERLGLSDKVLLVFISDHGEEFLDHGGHFHRQIYGETSNVPLVFWAPGRIEPGTVISETTQSIDLLPTMLELSGLPVPSMAQGQSLVPLLDPPEQAGPGSAQAGWRRRPAFTERLERTPAEASMNKPPEGYAVVFDGWKLVHNFEPSATWPRPEWELFDHVTDPLDQVNLADANPEVVERLGQLIDDWLEFAVGARIEDDAAAFDNLDPAELQRLRSLGYIN